MEALIPVPVLLGQAVAPFVREGEGQVFGKTILGSSCNRPSFVHLKTGLHHLDAKVVLLIDHHAEIFLCVHKDPAWPVALLQSRADQVPFDQQGPLGRLQITRIEVAQRLIGQILPAGSDHGIYNAVAFIRGRQMRKSCGWKISGESNTAAHHQCRQIA